MVGSMKSDAKVIVFEGLDASGKHTQAQRLYEYMIQHGRDPLLLSFPVYENQTGKMITEYLNGRMPKADPQFISMIYTMNRVEAFTTVGDLSKYDVLILDRYATSNYLYQMSKLPSNEWRTYIDESETSEYEYSKLPSPTQVFYLDLFPDNSRQLLLSRGRPLDKLEEDIRIQQKARAAAMFAAGYLQWTIIDCNGNPIRAEDDIFADIIKELNQ